MWKTEGEGYANDGGNYDNNDGTDQGEDFGMEELDHDGGRLLVRGECLVIRSKMGAHLSRGPMVLGQVVPAGTCPLGQACFRKLMRLKGWRDQG
jgi:hypothetical protein